MKPTLDEINVDGYHKVVKVTDESVGLIGIIAIHDLGLGPSLGGIRIRPYGKFEEALDDVLRLSKGMTYKSAMIENGLGGGKSVIIAKKKTEGMLRSFGKAIEMLGGDYIGAEDSGCTTSDVAVMRKETAFLVGLEHERSSGNPAPYTAWGTFRGIEAAAMKAFDSVNLEGKVVAIQGLGAVGEIMADLLFWRGARLIVADVDEERVERVARRYSAKAVGIEEIFSAECDIFAPCALGGAINKETIGQLKCKVVAGCANNQLAEEHFADDLHARGILYAPDFVINGGGLINVISELEPGGYDPKKARDGVDHIYERLLAIFNISEKNKVSTHKSALSLAEYRLKYGISKHENELCFHH